MLLEPDHNAVLLLLGWRTWYSGQGSLEALYPHALQFRLTQSKISPLCRRYRSCVRSLSKSHCIQAAPLAGHSPVLIRTQRPGSCCCYTRGAQSKLLYSIASCCASSHAYLVAGSCQSPFWHLPESRESRVASLESIV